MSGDPNNNNFHGNDLPPQDRVDPIVQALVPNGELVANEPVSRKSDGLAAGRKSQVTAKRAAQRSFRRKTGHGGTHSQVGARTSSSPVATTQPAVKNSNTRVISDVRNIPVFGGYYALYDSANPDVHSINIPHTEGKGTDGQLIYPPNPHHISAEIRKNMFKTYVKTSGNLFKKCASLYCSSRDITVVKELDPPSGFNFLYGTYCSKDYYSRTPELTRATLRAGDNKVDLTQGDTTQLFSEMTKLDSIYMGDVYLLPHLQLGNFVDLMIRTGTLKEVVWFGHMMSTPIGYQGESGLYHFRGKEVVSYPHKDPTPSDMYVHPPAFLLNGVVNDKLKCDVHDLGHMGTYVTFHKGGTNSLREAMERTRLKLGFRSGAIWPFLKEGGMNKDFYVYEKHVYKIMSEFRIRAGTPSSTILTTLQQALLKSLGMDDLYKYSDQFPSAAETRSVIFNETFGALCEAYNKRMAELKESPPIEELHLQPWWQRLGNAVSSRATTFTATSVAVIGAIRVLQGLRPGTIGYSLLSSLIGTLPVDIYSVCGAPVVEDYLFSRLSERFPPVIAALLMGVIDGVSNVSVASGIISFCVWILKLSLLAWGEDPQVAFYLSCSYHAMSNLVSVIGKYLDLLYMISPVMASLTTTVVLLAYGFVVYGVILYITIYLSNKPFCLQVLTIPVDIKDTKNAEATELLYHNVEVKVPEVVEVGGKTTRLGEILFSDTRVKMSSEVSDLLRAQMIEESKGVSLSSHKVETIIEIPDVEPFKPPPKTVQSYVYAIEKRILACTPPDQITFNTDFSEELKRVSVEHVVTYPLEAANSDNVEDLFLDVVRDLKAERRLTYERWWNTQTSEEKVLFMNGCVFDTSMCTRSMMLKLDEAQEVCKPRCLINAHVALNTFYKRYFDKIHGGLKRFPVSKWYARDGIDMRVFTIFAAGLTVRSLCDQVMECIELGWDTTERVRVVTCVAGDDTLLFVLERKDNGEVDVWYYETDATSFDASQGRVLLDEEMSVYEACGVPTEFLRLAAYSPIEVEINKFSKFDLSVKFALNVTGRATGFPNTSLGNSIVESILVHECLWKVFERYVQGKELFREVLDKTSIYVDRAKEMGVTFKKLYSGATLEKASFLRGFFYQNDEGDIRWAPAIGRLAKLSKTLAPIDQLYRNIPSSSERRRRFMYDVFYGLRTYDWPESMTVFDHMTEAPTLVYHPSNGNPSHLVGDEQVGKAYSLAVLARRYDIDYADLGEDGEPFFYSSKDVIVNTPNLSSCADILSTYYRYDYR